MVEEHWKDRYEFVHIGNSRIVLPFGTMKSVKKYSRVLKEYYSKNSEPLDMCTLKSLYHGVSKERARSRTTNPIVLLASMVKQPGDKPMIRIETKLPKQKRNYLMIKNLVYLN